MLVPVIVIVIAGAAAYLGGLFADNRDDRMISQALALDAKIVYYISEAEVRHNAYCPQYNRPLRRMNTPSGIASDTAIGRPSIKSAKAANPQR